MLIEKLAPKEMVRIDRAIDGQLMVAMTRAFSHADPEDKLRELDVQVAEEGGAAWVVTLTGLRTEEEIAWSYTFRVLGCAADAQSREALTEVAMRCRMYAMLRKEPRNTGPRP
jgi:hypothetical protein